MANSKSRSRGGEGAVKNIFDFINKNWQLIAVALAIVAFFVWYRALDFGALFNSQQESTIVDEQGQEPGVEEEGEIESEEVVPGDQAQESPVSGAPSTQPSPTPSPGVSLSDAVFVKQAKPGQGVTHLAREALKDYLTTVKPQVNLSREHQIYIEDYIKDAIGSEPLVSGQELTISRDTIENAITASQELTSTQLENLTQYANLVPSLQPYQPLMGS